VIYAVSVFHQHVEWGGMLYIGYRPTVGGSHKSIEVNIFDFDKDIYGETLTLHFRKMIRKDSKFDDLEDLKKQLERDKAETLTILKMK
jgi:riboflavin kinase/FMN adenylyltransferase